MEIWKDISGYETFYKVSNLGRVKRINKHGSKILNCTLDNKGYKVAHLSNGTQSKLKVHRLVACSFIPNPENKPEVNHINCNRSDNRVDNLEWSTRLENVQHSSRLGHYNRRKNHLKNK